MSPIEVKTRSGQIRNLDTTEIERLANRFRGSLIVGGDQEYEEARHIWNGSVDKRPAMILRCAGTADVMTAVDFVREQGLVFSVRAGGHNVSGAAIAEQGVVVDLSSMRSVRVDPVGRRALVEGGARLGDLDHETSPFGLAAPVGVVSETGVAGLTLHGGAGWLMRRHGLSIDNLISAEIVTADGKLRHVSTEEYPDLFWAIRGGGGNFGIVTGFEFRLHPVGPEVEIIMPIYAIDQARTVMERCRDYMATATDDLMVLGVYWSGPPLDQVPRKYQGQPVLILLGCYSGPAERAAEVAAALCGFAAPVANLSGKMPWEDAQKLLDEDYPDGKLYYWKSIYLDRLDREGMQVLEDFTLKRASPESSIDVWFLGGAVGRVPKDATAFYNRHYPIMIGIEANWSEPDRSEANIDWARQLHKELQQFSSGGNYLNFPGYVEDRDAMLKGAYGKNLVRLKQVKAKYDPGNLFPGLLNIPPGE